MRFLAALACGSMVLAASAYAQTAAGSASASNKPKKQHVYNPFDPFSKLSSGIYRPSVQNAGEKPPPPALEGTRASDKLPPPPPITAHRRASASSRTGRGFDPESIGKEETGRIDQAGKPVRFYPSPRAVNTAKSQVSAIRTNTHRNTAKPKNKYVTE
jgi:hypothetical protein